ncbi:MAG: ECF transporter S component [Clostridia bacterium]|nr:ECF transporter S component [Clostridia bacterium]
MSNPADKKNPALMIAKVGIMAALSYLAFTFVQIKISMGGDFSSFHLGNTFCVLAALLFGGIPGGIAGAIGMTIGDLLDPVYITSAPKTFVLKLLIGVITGLVAHKIGKISQRSSDGHTQDSRHVLLWTVLGSSAGMLFNVIAEPVVSYFYKRYILGVDAEASAVLAKLQSLTTFVNAVLTVIIAVALYSALRPAMIRTGLFDFNVGIKSKSQKKEVKADKD